MKNKKLNFLKCITIFLQYHFSLIFRFLLHVSWRENMRHEGRKPIWPILESFQHNIYFIIAASRFTLGHQWRTNETGVAKTVCGNKPVLSLKLEEKFISISLSWTIKKNWVQRQNWQNVINPVKPSTHRLMKHTNSFRPNPRRREEIDLNFYFRASLWCLKDLKIKF